MAARDLLGILIGLVAGSAMAVAVSSVWVVLMIPARLQDRLQAGSPRSLSLAMTLGLVLAALQNGLDLRLPLPEILGALALLAGGMFVGMLATALGEILEVVPVIFRRFRLQGMSADVRWVMLAGKVLGAVLGCLLYPIK